MTEKDQPGNIRISYGLKLPQAVVRSLSSLLVVSVFILMGKVVGAVGSFAPIFYLLVGLFILANMASYTELVLSLPRPSGTYTAVHNSEEGGWLAFSTGWLMILSGLILSAILAKGFSIQFVTLLRDLWGIQITPFLLSTAVLSSLVLFISFSQRRPERLRVVILLLVITLLLVLIEIPQFSIKNFSTPTIDWAGGLSVLLVSFVGLEITLRRISEIRNPQKNIPRVIIYIVGITGLMGALLSAMGIGLVGVEALEETYVPAAIIGRAITGGGGRLLLLMIGLVLTMIALNRSLMMVFGQIHTMSRDGFLPEFLRKARTKNNTPALLYGLTGILVLLLTLFPFHFLAKIGGELYLLILMIVNFTLARREQNVSSSFRLPFHPWIPYFILLIDGFLLLLWGSYLAIAALLIVIDSLIFMLYARHHHLEAKEGITVFKPPAERKIQEARYKILVPIANPDTAESLLHMAGTLARQQDGVVLALRVITVPTQTPLSEGRRRAASERILLDRALDQANKEDFEIQTMTRVSREVHQGILDTAREENVDQILLGWGGKSTSFGTSLGSIIDPIIQRSACDVLVVKGSNRQEIKDILLPTAGGPNAAIAASIASAFSHVYDARVTGLYVQVGNATPARMRENEKVIEETLGDNEFSTPPQHKVIVAENVVDGILKEAVGYDLVLIGASEERIFDQFAFGSIPQRIASRVPSTAIMVKRFRGAPDFWMRRGLQGIFNLFPTLEPYEQLEVREDLSDSAQPGVNYFVLSILSSIIAALGLLLNSPAVVIGAMLVAPLMSPVLGFSLGIILGEIRLIRVSFESVFKGVIASILVSILVGLLSPFKELTTEIMSRTQPTLLDLFIALASGMAGAYAISRKDVSAALPGVAIAAALAPPLSVVGIGLALGRPDIAGGSMLLFITNIISINLGAVIIFTLLGLRPQNWLPETQRRIRRGVIGLISMVIIIAIPLGVIMNGIIKQTRQQQAIHQVLIDHPLISDQSIVEISDDRVQDQLIVNVTVRASKTIDQAATDKISQQLEERLDQPLTLEITTLPTTRSE